MNRKAQRRKEKVRGALSMRNTATIEDALNMVMMAVAGLLLTVGGAAMIIRVGLVNGAEVNIVAGSCGIAIGFGMSLSAFRQRSACWFLVLILFSINFAVVTLILGGLIYAWLFP